MFLLIQIREKRKMVRMKKYILLILVCNFILTNSVLAGPNDSQLTTHEQNQQDIQKNRQEIQNSGTQPNMKSAPTQVNVGSWGIDSTARFDITNHLFGYSTLIDKDTNYDGVKLTGFLNLGFYSPRDNNDGNKKKSRLVVGAEEPIWNFSNQLALFIGGGVVFGQSMGLYADTGLDFYILSWIKTQIGANYTTANGHVSPQLSLGFSW